MPTFTSSIPSPLQHLTLIDVLDIAIVAVLIYQILMAVRGRRAAHILIGVLTLVGVYAAVDALGLELVRTMLAALVPYLPFALIVLFQSELRRLLARIGGVRWISIGGRLQKREFTEELVLALTQLSEKQVGALVVLERDIGLRSFIESGVPLDACMSRDLLLTIFHPGSALHDGAVIIQGDRIAAAACFLPLTVKPTEGRGHGTRHRAAIGVTEEADCLSLIVSEETGRMSVAEGGKLESDLTPAQLTQRITEHLIRGRGHRRASSQQPAPIKPEVVRDAPAD